LHSQSLAEPNGSLRREEYQGRRRNQRRNAGFGQSTAQNVNKAMIGLSETNKYLHVRYRNPDPYFAMQTFFGSVKKPLAKAAAWQAPRFSSASLSSNTNILCLCEKM
jgi:hypothetical protein